MKRCDFCSAEPAPWRYPTHDFVQLVANTETGRAVINPSTDDWYACDTCHEFIEGEKWESLAARAEKSVTRDLGLDEINMVARMYVRRLHKDFRENRKGPAVREV